MVLINTGTTGKLNRSTVHPSLFNKSSDFHTVFFRASHKSKRMEKNRCILLFSRTISHFKGNFTKFKDISRTNSLAEIQDDLAIASIENVSVYSDRYGHSDLKSD